MVRNLDTIEAGYVLSRWRVIQPQTRAHLRRSHSANSTDVAREPDTAVERLRP